MATEAVLNWIGGAECPPGQEPIKLSRNIESFENDFSNGYLFGEILAHYSLLDISQFSKKFNKEAKVTNFFQVEEVLRHIGVKFDAKLIHMIMNEERGASLRLLYQIKLALDKHFSQSDITVTNLKQKTVDERAKRTTDLALRLPEIHKQYGVEGPTFKSEKLQIIEKKLLKFEVARANLLKKAQDDNLTETNMLMSIQQAKRQEAMRKLQENKQFMKEWEADGRKNWKQNREIRAKEIERQLYFENREIKLYKDKLTRALVQHTTDMNQGIDEFHENMTRQGIEQDIPIEEAIKRQEEKKGIPPGQIQNFSYAATMNKIKETKNNNEFAAKERERRNRKQLVDQRKIQERLDAAKYEENLIQRLLEKQTSEQQTAYTNWRQEQCRNIVFDNRRTKAEEMQVNQQKKNQEIEEDMRKAANELEPKRQAEHLIKKDQLIVQRREEKQRKRRVNIEIASELIDLIMDVADVAYNQLVDAPSTKDNSDRDQLSTQIFDEQQLIKKAQWRHWMDVISQGKKVSEENLVITTDDGGVTQQADSMQQIGLSTTKVPYKLMLEMKNEQIYEDLLQYISMSGPLNLRIVAADKWHQFKQIVEKDDMLKQSNINLSFLNELYAPKNKELGIFLDQLYNGSKEDATSMQMARLSFADASLGKIDTNKASKEVIIEDASVQGSQVIKTAGASGHVTDFPSYHSIKLCIIGKAFSGKQTQVKYIKSLLGDKVTVFEMGKVVREALSYVDPSQVKDEQVDPKAKGGKGKQADAPVDIFAGKDTTQYKEIANLILKQVQLTTGIEDALPTKDVDILQLVSDDNLLVQLFIQRLKLHYPAQGQSQEEKEQQMRANIDKEKELLEQLEEAKNESAEVDPKKKAKGVRSPQEIQDEINNLLSFDKSGWILMDFPRNLNQAKILENAFTGFTPITDQQKSKKQENYEVWSKFADPETTTAESYTGEIDAQPSLFDGIFVMDAQIDECLRRAQGRKIDPTTGTIYHKTDSPPPEADAKLQERLIDFFGDYANDDDMVQKIKLNHTHYSDNEYSLNQFISQFGQLDKITGKGIEALCIVNSNSGKSTAEVQQQIKTNIDKILKFKQIDQDRQYTEVKRKVKQEEADKIAAEEAAAAAAQAAEQETPAQEKAPEQQPAPEDNLPVDQVDQDKSQALDKNLPTTLIKEVDRASKSSLHSRTSQHISMSKQSVGAALGGSRQKQKRISYTREYKIKLWEEMESAYIKEGILALSDIKRQRQSVTDGLNNCQRQFIEFLERPCNKQEKVYDFVQSFNTFSMEFPDLRKDDQTKDELMNRAQRLSNELWSIIEQRKEESLAQIEQQSSGGWSDQEMRHLIRNMASLIEIEIKKFSTVYQIVMHQEPPNELDAEILAKKLLDRGVATFDGALCTSPVLEQVFNKLLQNLNECISANPQVQLIMLDYEGQILKNERDIFIYKLALINTWALAILQEIHIHSRQVYDQLDDWIVEAVAQENAICQEIITQIKEFIQIEKLTIEDFECQLQPLRLDQRIQTFQFRSDEVPLYLRQVHIPYDKVDTSRFNLDDLKNLYMQMRYVTGSLGNGALIDQQSFIHMLVIAFRQGRIPLTWKYEQFSNIVALSHKFAVQPLFGPSQDLNESPKMYQSKLGAHADTSNPSVNSSFSFVNWKTALTFFALMGSPLPSEQDLAQLRVQLSDSRSDDMEPQFIKKKQFAAIEFWFDQYEGKPDSTLQAKWEAEKAARQEESDYESEDDEKADNKKWIDKDRVRQIKELLFDIFRVPTGEDKLSIPDFINTLIEQTTMAGSAQKYIEFMF